MNKGFLAIAALAVVAGIGGYAAIGNAGKTGAASSLASVSVADAPLRPVKADGEDLAPNGVYEGVTTPSGAITGDVALGAEDAPVTIIEYASLTCPHCATFHAGPFKQLKADYIDTGKVRFIYRDYPLNDPAVAATMIARCGGEDRYMAFIDLFMEQQKNWATSSDLLGELLKLARLGGLGKEQVEACLGDNALGQNVLDRMRAGAAKFNVNSTPSVIVNGSLLSGAGNYETLKAKIDSLIDG